MTEGNSWIDFILCALLYTLFAKLIIVHGSYGFKQEIIKKKNN